MSWVNIVQGALGMASGILGNVSDFFNVFR